MYLIFGLGALDLGNSNCGGSPWTLGVLAATPNEATFSAVIGFLKRGCRRTIKDTWMASRTLVPRICHALTLVMLIINLLANSP